mgnify:CR=1 FL=1|jgi:hypothetical protein
MTDYSSPAHHLADSGGAPVPASLASIPSPSGDLVITETGGVIDNGLFTGWKIGNWANMGDVGGGQTPVEEHSGGYTELCCLNKSSQCRFWYPGLGGVPWPNNGTAAQDGIFLQYPKNLIGDFALECSISHGHAGHNLFGNGAIGLVARRPSDPARYQIDTRVSLGASNSPANSNWTPRGHIGTPVAGTGTGNISNTTRTWLKMDREGPLMRFYWKASAPAGWTELNAPGLQWDVGGEVEVGFGYGAHVEKDVIRIYDFEITGIEAP